MITRFNFQQRRRGIQGFSNRRYTYESQKSNLTLGRTVKILQTSNLFFYLLYQIDSANYRIERQSLWRRSTYYFIT